MNRFVSIFILLFSSLMVSAIEPDASNNIDSVVILKKKLDSLRDTEEKVQTLYAICRLLYYKSDPEALTFGNKSLELAKHLGNKKEQANASNIIGAIYFESGILKQALSHFLFALNIYKELADWGKYSMLLNNVGGVYRNLGNLDKACFYFNKALQLNIYLKDSSRQITNLSNIGLVLYDKHKIPEALYYYNQAYHIDTLLTIKDPYIRTSSTSVCLQNLTYAYLELKDYDKALAFSIENIRITEGSGISLLIIANYATIGEIYIRQQEYNQAKKYCQLGLDLAKKHKMISAQANLCKKLSLIYEKLGDSSRGLLYLKTNLVLRDSLYDEQNTKQTHQMAALYESNIKDEKIKSLNKDKEIAFAKANNERLFTNFIIAIALLMILMGFIVARNIILKHRKRLSEEKALAEIEKKRFERDKARLMHENVSAKYEVLKSKINPHFLFNSLAALSSIIPEEAHQAEEFIDHFSDFYRKIIETGDVELLPLQDELNIVKTYLYLQQLAIGENLIVDINIAEPCMQLLVPPFAVQMVVENAIKHNEISSSNPLKIAIITNEDSLMITNTIRRRTKEPVSTGIGEKNIIERYKLFSVNIPQFKDEATEYIVTLPLLTEKSPSLNIISSLVTG